MVGSELASPVGRSVAIGLAIVEVRVRVFHARLNKSLLIVRFRLVRFSAIS